MNKRSRRHHNNSNRNNSTHSQSASRSRSRGGAAQQRKLQKKRLQSTALQTLVNLQRGKEYSININNISNNYTTDNSTNDRNNLTRNNLTRNNLSRNTLSCNVSTSNTSNSTNNTGISSKHRRIRKKRSSKAEQSSSPTPIIAASTNNNNNHNNYRNNKKANNNYRNYRNNNNHNINNRNNNYLLDEDGEEEESSFEAEDEEDLTVEDDINDDIVIEDDYSDSNASNRPQENDCFDDEENIDIMDDEEEENVSNISASSKPGRSSSNSNAKLKKNVAAYIEVRDKALAMNLNAKNEFNENNDGEKVSNLFKIQITSINPKGLALDQGKYDPDEVLKQLKLQNYQLTNKARGSSPCWQSFYCIINEEQELIDYYAYCFKCNKIFYKGSSGSNLLDHHRAEMANNKVKEKQDESVNDKLHLIPRSNADNDERNQQFVPLNTTTISELRLTGMFFINCTYSSFEMINHQQYIDHVQSWVDAGAKHGSFDVRATNITPYKIKQSTIKTAKSIVSTQQEIITSLCEENVLPPISLLTDIYGDKHLQRANIGLDAFAVINYNVKELRIGVVPIEGIADYILRHGGNNGTEFVEDQWAENGDANNPGGYKSITFMDGDGIEHEIKIPIKNWINIQNALSKLIKLFGVKNRAADIFQIIFVTDKGSNIKLAVEEWILFVSLICMAHRTSTVCKTSLRQTREQIAGLDRMITSCSALINIINKSSWRSKMNPHLKSLVITRFWGNEDVWNSVIPNFERMKAFAIEHGHEDKIRFRKATAISFHAPLSNTKSMIKQIESRTYPTMQLFMPSITTLFNDKYKEERKESNYSKGFKKHLRKNIVGKILPDIKFEHLLASYLNPLTRDMVWKFVGVSRETWDGQQKRTEMRDELIKRLKELKKLCESLGKGKPKPKAKKKGRGRPKKTKNNDTSWDLLSFGANSMNVDISETIETVTDSEEDDEDEIPKEIIWYENYDVSLLLKKYDAREIMQNPLLMYKENHQHIFYMDMIAKWNYAAPLTSNGVESLFNDCGITRSSRRATLLQELATDVDAIQKWARAFGTKIENKNKQKQ